MTDLIATVPGVVAQFIPSPSEGVWYLGPLPIRGYALSIILGIIVAVWIGERRWAARGGTKGEISDLALWAVPFGIVGGRLYHVATDKALYFGDDKNPWSALYVWRGGLGIWGAIALGAVGVIIAARVKGIRLLPVLDALAPAALMGQAIGRWGNWWNQELFGKPTDLPWALKIDSAHWPSVYDYDPPSTVFTEGDTTWATFHPTFLYESLWCLAGFALLIWLDRRFKLGHGKMIALYVMVYTAGRGWIEYLRIDDVELSDVLGLRFNVWMSIVCFVLAAAYLIWALRRRPGQEVEVYRDRAASDRQADSGSGAGGVVGAERPGSGPESGSGGGPDQ
ncbi:prolipoprotein diacylglyceryl transferase [soil metagenome]